MLSKVSNSHLADHLPLAWLSGFSWAFFWKIYEYLFNKEGAVRIRNHNEDILRNCSLYFELLNLLHAVAEAKRRGNEHQIVSSGLLVLDKNDNGSQIF